MTRSIDLAPEERSAVERLLGRTLADDESIQIVVQKEPDLAARRAAAARILELAKGKSLGEKSIRELLDEDRR